MSDYEFQLRNETDAMTMIDLDYSTLSLGVNYNYSDIMLFSLEYRNIDKNSTDDFSETLQQALIAF